MSFCCFIPGQPIITSDAFQQMDSNRWAVTLTAATEINELSAFVTQPLPTGMALGCHVASGSGSGSDSEKWHYLGPITNDAPSVVFKTRYVWSDRDAVPTTVQFGIVMEAQASLACMPAERVSSEVVAAAKSIGNDLHNFVSSFATPVVDGLTGERRIQLPQNVLDKWMARFASRCQRDGLDWLSSSNG